jgi:hypothetical protein
MDDEAASEVSESTRNIDTGYARQTRYQDARPRKFTRDFIFDAGTNTIHVHGALPLLTTR